MTIRAAIVDDEPLARRRIRNLLAEAADVEVIAECANGKDAIESLEASPPALLFLDVQMPEIDGFDVLQAIGVDRVPAVIFVTAYDQFALRAFEAHALDYLLKPFDDERFGAALERARERIRQQQGGDLDRRLQALLENVRAEHGYLRRLVVPSGHRSVFVRTEHIDWIEAERNYVRLHVGGRAHLLRENLTHIASALDPATFCRIHRSTIVNIDRIQAVESLFHGEQLVVLQDGTKLTAGRSYRRNLLAIMERSDDGLATQPERRSYPIFRDWYQSRCERRDHAISWPHDQPSRVSRHHRRCRRLAGAHATGLRATAAVGQAHPTGDPVHRRNDSGPGTLVQQSPGLRGSRRAHAGPQGVCRRGRQSLRCDACEPGVGAVPHHGG
jgi:two-component system LytT family response regulator